MVHERIEQRVWDSSSSEHVEKLPLPVATDPTLPVSDPQAQEFLDKLPDLTSPDFSLEQMRRLIAEGRALAAAMCPHNKL